MLSALQGLDPLSEVLLAWKHNGRLLQPDHGYPLRVVIPGALCCAAPHCVPLRCAVSFLEADQPCHAKQWNAPSKLA